MMSIRGVDISVVCRGAGESGGQDARAVTIMICRVFILAALLAVPAWAGGRMIVVVGAAGEADYERQFAQWADRWAAAGRTASMRIEQIGRDAATTQPATAASRPASDKDRLRTALQSVAGPSAEPLWLVLIGHGTAEGQDAKFNLRGPDVSDAELAEWLKPVERPVAVIDCASASGPFLNRLSGKDRVVITATRSGSEHQFARFGDYLSTSVVDPAADLDKDGRPSLLEAFLMASRQVEAFYKQNGRLATEHALLDDNGDGLGVSADWFDGVRPTRAARTGAAVDGSRANAWFLRPSAGGRELTADESRRRDALEAAIDALRRQKAAMPEADYYAKLEPLMIELAKLYER